jgi:uncharacterized protein YndB with AHSA1/START domain
MEGIFHEIYIRASQSKVYETLTSAAGWDAWFTTGTFLEIKPDGTGEVRLRWERPDGSIIKDGGKIVKAYPSSVFSFEWEPGESKTLVKIVMEPYRSGTLVRLKEEGYRLSQKDKSALVSCAAGWGEALMLLKMYLEYGIVCKDDLIF